MLESYRDPLYALHPPQRCLKTKKDLISEAFLDNYQQDKRQPWQLYPFSEILMLGFIP